MCEITFCNVSCVICCIILLRLYILCRQLLRQLISEESENDWCILLRVKQYFSSFLLHLDSDCHLWNTDLSHIHTHKCYIWDINEELDYNLPNMCMTFVAKRLAIMGRIVHCLCMFTMQVSLCHHCKCFTLSWHRLPSCVSHYQCMFTAHKSLCHHYKRFTLFLYIGLLAVYHTQCISCFKTFFFNLIKIILCIVCKQIFLIKEHNF